MMRSRRWYLILGCIMVGALVLVAILAEQITAVSPYYMGAKRYMAEGGPPFEPDANYPIGSDRFGRDLWSRLAYGTRWSLFFAFLIMVGRMLIAVPLGILAAFGPRLFGWLTGRFYVFTSAIPPLLFYLLILSAPGLRTIGLWPSITLTVGLLTVLEWPRLAVIVKGRLEELWEEQFIEGALAVGATRGRIFWSHLMPHLWPTLVHMIVAEMGRGLLVMAQLGVFSIFMGGGIFEEIINSRAQIVTVITTSIPEWGMLLSDSRTLIYMAPWIPIYTATAFFVGVVGLNLLAQGLEGARFSFALPPRWRWVALALIASLLAVWILPVADRSSANTGPVYYQFRGRHTDVEAVYDPLNPSKEAVEERRHVTLLTSLADHAFAAAAVGFPKGVRARLPITLYPTQADFIDVVAKWVPEGEGVTLYHEPGKRLHVSPAFILDYNRRNMLNSLTYESIIYLAISQQGGSTGLFPVVLGAYEVESEGLERYRIDIDKLANGPFLSLAELFTTAPAELPQSRQALYAAQSALMIEFFERQGLAREQIVSQVQGSGDGLAALAQALSMRPAELDRQYQAELIRRIEEASVLHMPAGRARIPRIVTDTVAAEAEATPGMQAFVLDWDERRNESYLYVLEHRAQPDGSVVGSVVVERWVVANENDDGPGRWTRVTEWGH